MAKKSKRRKPGVIRPSAVPVEVYNEGLCAYVWDEGNADVLRKMLAGGKYPECSPDVDFFSNLSNAKFGKDVASKGLAVAYTLEQDDGIEAEVGVGDPLTEEELGKARWLEPQRARLTLPTGRLRIDTANTMPLDPDHKSDSGAVVEVPPGRCALTLYRIDWDEMARAGLKRYNGPQEFILLTPIESAGRFKSTSPILEFTFRKTNPEWKRDHRIAKDTFDGRLLFNYFWEGFAVNLDRKGAERMGLRPGSRMQFRCEKFVLDALFLDDMTTEDFMTYFSRERLDAESEPFKEFALSRWSESDGTVILYFNRYKSKRAASERLHGVWTPATGVVLPQAWDLPRPAVDSPARIEKGVIHGAVQFSSSHEVVLNVSPLDLEAIGAKPGELLQLRTEHSQRTLVIALDAMSRFKFSIVTQSLSPTHEKYCLQMAANTGYHFFTLADLEGEKPYSGELTVTSLGDERWPVIGYWAPNVGQREGMVLRLAPFSWIDRKVPDNGLTDLSAETSIQIGRPNS